jgi:hypothetical protein
MTGGTGGGASCSLIGIASSGMGGKCCSASFTQRYFTTHPGTPYFDSFSRSVVFRVLLLEIGEYMLGAVSLLFVQQHNIKLFILFR